MSWEEPTADDEPLARPFLSRPDVAPGAARSGAASGAPSGWPGPPSGAEPGGPAPPGVGRHVERPASATRAVQGAAAARAGYPPESTAAPVARPAAGAPVHPPAHPPAAPPAHPVPQTDDVRPYLLTGGRTRSRGAAVAMETVVMSTGARPVRVFDAAGQERLRIVQLAERPCSTAEVAAWLHLPLQVALVLVSDLVAEGLLNATRVATSQSDDVHFLERLIAGVAAL